MRQLLIHRWTEVEMGSDPSLRPPAREPRRDHQIIVRTNALECSVPLTVIRWAGADPQRSFKFAGANVRYPIAKRTFNSLSQLGS